MTLEALLPTDQIGHLLLGLSRVRYSPQYSEKLTYVSQLRDLTGNSAVLAGIVLRTTDKTLGNRDLAYRFTA